jgi:hypothetical protein
VRVIHNDSSSIHLVNDDMTAAVTGIADSASPVLTLTARGAARIDGSLWTGSLIAARRMAQSHNRAVSVKAFMSLYVDSGKLDAYRAAHGTPDGVPLTQR